ncbi:MAG: NAD-dependent deacylase [Planctomycetota bacterium]|nr:MAG: NAD-dependent deacylase [Planctomycetota bacterium]
MSLDAVRERLASARSIVVLTGAGISGESGVPTFRGAGGLWRDYRAEDLATPEAFARDPRLVWEWYDWRRRQIAPAKPNLGHYALVTLEKRAPELTLITQNVDGLHPAAGSRNLLEIHGNLWRTRCLSCGDVRENRETPLARIPPHCTCEGLLRPDVVWFGEALPSDLLEQAIRAVETCDLMLVVGTSGVVQPAASMADTVLARGMPVVEINLDPTKLSDQATYALQGRAGEILPKLIA